MELVFLALRCVNSLCKGNLWLGSQHSFMAPLCSRRGVNSVLKQSRRWLLLLVRAKLILATLSQPFLNSRRLSNSFNVLHIFYLYRDMRLRNSSKFPSNKLGASVKSALECFKR